MMTGLDVGNWRVMKLRRNTRIEGMRRGREKKVRSGQR
jgi:hypothetical protein